MKNKILFFVFLLFSSLAHSISFVKLVPSILLGNVPASILFVKMYKSVKLRKHFANNATKQYELFLKMSDEDKDKYFKKLTGEPFDNYSKNGNPSKEDLMNFVTKEHLGASEMVKLAITSTVASYSTWVLSSFLIYKVLDKLGVK